MYMREYSPLSPNMEEQFRGSGRIDVSAGDEKFPGGLTRCSVVSFDRWRHLGPYIPRHHES